MPTTWYLQLDVTQEPFDLNVDEAGRPRYAFNVMADKGYSTTFLEEIMALLQAGGVGIIGVNIFATSKARIPAGDGPYLSLMETGGTAPLRIHNQIAPPMYQRPGAQVVTRAKEVAEARAMAWAAYNVLAVVRNTHVAF